MPLRFTTAQNDDDLRKILALQAINQHDAVSPEVAHNQGFVTVIHPFEVLKAMDTAEGQIIAKDGDILAGYALVMPRSFRTLVPVLQPMFDTLDTLLYKGKPLENFYVMGQICVAEAYRGQGVFDGLYAAHKSLLAQKYEVCITEISARNPRSLRAHERVGFETIYVIQDTTDLWHIVALPLTAPQ